ncbi:MAG: pectate lyase [Dysgonamonadaceae bacterium]|jgi:pectate lyase|nr:pectate lyase [Dysgonamonadaceae bacterium]
MKYQTLQIVLGFFFVYLFSKPAQAQEVMDTHPLPAFPGAEGAGMYATGGRGGNCYFVTSLEDTLSGNKKTREGTLRWCLKQPGPRTILFRTAGIIRLKKILEIPENTTIAGQSAPGGGICIADYPVRVKGDNVIVRYMRFRMGDRAKVQDDSFSGTRNKNVIIDHCSMSWSTDECASFYDNENFTMQWCILSESLRQSVHEKGSHGYGAIWGGKKASFHHNLLARHDSRNPRFCGSRYSNLPGLELVDFRNNVIFAWGSNSGYAGEGGRYNFINNYYKSGEASIHKDRIFQPNADIGANRQPAGVWGTFYLSGNFVAGYPDVTANNRLGFHPNPASKNIDGLLSETPFPAAFVTTQTAEEAYQLVLKSAGASMKRDETDKRIIRETQKGLPPTFVAGVKNDTGFVNSQSEVGGWDEYSYESSRLPEDNDRDGIPDAWLNEHFPGKKSLEYNENGYTYLEVYLNGVVF